MPKSKIKVQSNFLQAPEAIRAKNNDTSKNLRKKGKKTQYIISLSIILFLCLSAGLVYFLGVFNVHSINVKGNSQVSTKNIEDYVLNKTNNNLILNVNPDSIEKDLLKEFSLLSFARVTKELPSTLSVEVKERSSAAVIKTVENTVLIAEDGTVVEEINEDQIQNNMYHDMPVVKMIDESKKVKGDTLDPKLIKNLSTVINSWKSYKSSSNPNYKAPTFSDILLDKDKNLKFILDNGSTAILTLINDDQDYNSLVSDTITTYLKLNSDKKKIKTIDMRYDNKVITTYFN